MEQLQLIARFLQEGGPFMYPIALLLAIGLVIILERWIFLARARRSNRKAFEAIMPLMVKREFGRAKTLAEQTEAPVGQMVATGLDKIQHTRRRADLESAIEEGVLASLPRIERRTPYLATLANVATLLGLLGTIIGLIAAFTAVAGADPAEKAALLSQSISVAMNTTAFGLMAAIPLLLAHSLLQTRTSEIIDNLEVAGVKLINMLVDFDQPGLGAVPNPAGAA
jgi:biopolymer transport protein ExbB